MLTEDISVLKRFRGLSEDELYKEADKIGLPRNLIDLAIKFGFIKPNHPLPKYLEEAVRDPKDPNKTGYETIVVWAVQGSGKSNFMLQTGYWLYGDWEKTLRNFVFTPREFHRRIKSIPKTKHIPWLGWDDIGVHYSYMSYKTNTAVYEAIGEAWHAIRTKVNVIVPTLPVLDHLPKNVKDNITVEVFIGRNQNVLIRRWFRLPSLRPHQDSFLVRLPIEPVHKIDLYEVPFDVFARYWARRLELTNQATNEIGKVLDLVDEVKKTKPPTITEFKGIARDIVGISASNYKLEKFYHEIFDKMLGKGVENK